MKKAATRATDAGRVAWFGEWYVMAASLWPEYLLSAASDVFRV